MKIKVLYVLFFLCIFMVGCTNKYTITGKHDVNEGESITLTIDGLDSDEVEWVSSDNTIATVMNGIVMGLNEGEVTISVIKDSKTIATHNITVLKYVYVSVENSITVAIGEVKPLKVSSNQKEFIFSFESKDPSIVSVDLDGYITGIKAGIASIMVSNIYTFNTLITVNVIEYYEPATIEILNTQDTYYYNQTYKLDTKVLPNFSNPEVVWNTFNKDGIIYNSETNEITFYDTGEFYLFCSSVDNPKVNTSYTFNVVYPDDINVTSLLFLGNSHTYFNDVPKLVEDIGKAAGMVLNCESITEGGATISTLLFNYEKDIRDLLTKTDFDYIIVQEQSSLNFQNYYNFLYATSKLKSIADEYGVDLILYQTWAYEENSNQLNDLGISHDEMHLKIQEAYQNVSTELEIPINPVGQVVYEFSQEYPEYRLYHDGNHLNISGSYLSACVHFMSIFDIDIVGNTSNVSINDDDKLKLQTFVSEYINKQ